MVSIQEYKYPKEHVFDGITFCTGTHAATLRRIKEELELEHTDIVLATYPKSGTTWMQEIIYSILVGPDKAARRTEPMDDIFRFVDMQRLLDGEPIYNYDLLLTESPPRLVKTHLPCSFYERHLQDSAVNPKFIIVMRNPKDTLVSFYHFHRMITPMKFEFTWDEFYEKFEMGTIANGDVIDYSLSWWKHRHHPNVLIVHYEDLLADSDAVIRQVAEFLERPQTEEERQAIAENASFGKMKERGRASYLSGGPEIFDETKASFFRKAAKGNWRNHLTEVQSARIDELIKEKCEPVGLNFRD